jgi:hypothetical protein
MSESGGTGSAAGDGGETNASTAPGFPGIVRTFRGETGATKINGDGAKAAEAFGGAKTG